MTNKQEKMMKLIEQLQELFPELANIATNDLSNPDFLMIASDESFASFSYLLQAAEVDVKETTVFDELMEDDDMKKLIEWDGEDEGNGGILQ